MIQLKYKLLLILFCIAFSSKASEGEPTWFGNNHFKIKTDQQMVSITMAKMPWESFSVAMANLAAAEGYLSFSVKTEERIILRVDGLAKNNAQVHLFNQEILPGKFQDLTYRLANAGFQLNHLVFYVNPGKSFTGEVQIKALKIKSALEKEDLLAVYPNPATGAVTLHLPHSDFSQVTIYNNLGQLLITKPVSGNQMKLNLSGYKPGVYLVKVKGQQASKTAKIIVE